PRLLGVRAVIARSFARIHRANLVNWGIVPLSLVDPDAAVDVVVGDSLDLSGLSGWLRDTASTGCDTRPMSLPVINRRTGAIIHVTHDLTPREVAVVLAGGLLPYTRAGSSV